MAVLGRLLVSSAERLDLADLLNIDSFGGADWKYFMRSMVGNTKPYVLKGFEVINPNDSLGGHSVSITVADSIVFYPSSKTGSFFHGLESTHALAQPLVPELRKNATNYVYITLTTVETAKDTRAFWDPDKENGNGGEFTQDVNTESALKVEAGVSVSSFPSGVVPICKVVVGPSVIISIEDARDMMFRLGTGGISPSPTSTFNWRAEPSAPYARLEPPTTISSPVSPNPFSGADKNIRSMKEWMDAVMTKLLELGGTTYWYQDTSSTNLISLFSDALGTTVKSKGQWKYDSVTEGQLEWTEDVLIQSIIGPKEVLIRAGTKVLNNDQVMYLKLIRNSPINNFGLNISFINGVNYFNGIINSFGNLNKGDWVKKSSDDSSLYYRIDEFYADYALAGGVTTPLLAKSIKINDIYSGLSDSAAATYAKGVYQPTDISVNDRDASAIAAAGGNLFWLAMRSDTIQNVFSISTQVINGSIAQGDGEKAKFTSVAHGLIDSDRVQIAGSTNYDGIYEVEVADSNNFYISTSITVAEAGVNAYIALCTTSARNNGFGLQLESANHGFDSGQNIRISGTSSSFDGLRTISVRSSTSFSFPIGANIPSVAAGSATLARMNVRSESGVAKVIRGEVRNIGEAESDATMKFIGMQSPNQDHPTYEVPASYNTLQAQENFNSLATDSLTVRVSRLTAMMADRVQDRDIRVQGITQIRNTVAGANQVITASNTVVLERPGSPQQVVTLSATLPANSAAIINIDRNSSAAISTTVVSLGSPYLLDENKIVLLYRFSDQYVYTWNGVAIKANGTYTFGNPETAQSKNIAVSNPGGIKFDTGSGLVTFSDPAADVTIIMNGSPFNNIIDVSVINALGIFIIPDGYSAWIRVDRRFAKVFNGIDNADSADTVSAGIIHITTQASTPVDQDVLVLFSRIGDNLVQTHAAIPPQENVYEENLYVVPSAPANDNEIQATPIVPSGTNITLPLDSRDGNSTQKYVVGSGILEIFLNGQYLNYSEWTEIGAMGAPSTIIQLNQDLYVTDVVTFRIDTTGGFFFGSGGGGGSGSLQDAYDIGRTITVASGQPIIIMGVANQKLLEVYGDIKVSGIIDPKGVTFDLQAIDPLAATDNGLWVDLFGDIWQKRGNVLSEVNLTNAGIGEIVVRAVGGVFANNTGGTITKSTPVRVDSLGNMGLIDVSIESQALASLGLCAANVLNSGFESIISNGRLEDVVNSFTFGDLLYVSKTGGLTNVKPSVGVGGFVSDDFIIKVGVLIKNRDNPLLKDILINMQIIGQLA